MHSAVADGACGVIVNTGTEPTDEVDPSRAEELKAGDALRNYHHHRGTVHDKGKLETWSMHGPSVHDSAPALVIALGRVEVLLQHDASQHVVGHS